jgi:hypothetical protein
VEHEQIEHEAVYPSLLHQHHHPHSSQDQSNTQSSLQSSHRHLAPARVCLATNHMHQGVDSQRLHQADRIRDDGGGGDDERSMLVSSDAHADRRASVSRGGARRHASSSRARTNSSPHSPHTCTQTHSSLLASPLHHSASKSKDEGMEEEDMWHSYACSLPHKHQQSRDAGAQIAPLLALGEDTRCGGSRGERKVSQHLSRAPSLEEDEDEAGVVGRRSLGGGDCSRRRCVQASSSAGDSRHCSTPSDSQHYSTPSCLRAYESEGYESSVSTECPSIRESLMGGSKTSSTRSTFSSSTNANESQASYSSHPTPRAIREREGSGWSHYDTPSFLKTSDKLSRISPSQTHSSEREREGGAEGEREEESARASAGTEARARELIHVDADELRFSGLTGEGGAYEEKELIVHNVSSCTVALSYTCLDDDEQLGKVASRNFSLCASMSHVLSPGQTSSLKISCRVPALTSSGEGGKSKRGGEGGGVLVIVAMDVSMMSREERTCGRIGEVQAGGGMKTCTAMRQPECHEVVLRIVSCCTQASSGVTDTSCSVSSRQMSRSPPSASSTSRQGMRTSSRCEDDAETREHQERLLSDCVATCEDARGASASQALGGEAEAEEGLGASWFADCSVLDLGQIYIQERDKRVIGGRISSCVVTLTNPNTKYVHLQLRARSFSAQGSPLFAVSEVGQEHTAASQVLVTVPARGSCQVKVSLDISDYSPSAGCITCTGELQISNLASFHHSEATVGNSKSEGTGMRGHGDTSMEMNACKSVCIKLTCVAGFCRMQIPSCVEEMHMACEVGHKDKYTLALRNGGCLPATVRLTIQDEQASGGGGPRGEVTGGGFQVKQSQVGLGAGQVAKVTVLFVPQQTREPYAGIDMCSQTAGGLTYKSRLVLRVEEDPGIHYSLPLWGQVLQSSTQHPQLPLSSIPPFPLAESQRQENVPRKSEAPGGPKSPSKAKLSTPNVILTEDGTQTSFCGDSADADLRKIRGLRGGMREFGRSGARTCESDLTRAPTAYILGYTDEVCRLAPFLDLLLHAASLIILFLILNRSSSTLSSPLRCTSLVQRG